jgi:2,3-diaminopropionate biosynthesis protein SbnB
MSDASSCKDSLITLTAEDVRILLANREPEIMGVIEAAYCIHARGGTNCPHSLFLRLGERNDSRIIALPAYVGDRMDVAGIKWISSFPSNLDVGLPRASGLIVLNSVQTGRAYALMEGSIISAKRTAASATVAATRLVPETESVTHIGMIGCGQINREVLTFMMKAFPRITDVTAFDCNATRLDAFVSFCERNFSVNAKPVKAAAEVLEAGRLVSIATNAVDPHIATLSPCPASTLILHLSLRDLAPEIMYGVENIVDDIDHVCRASTSLDRATRALGTRNFIRTTIGAILTGEAEPPARDGRIVVFSPFGLGILDVCLASHVYRSALINGRGRVLEGFHGGT